MRRIFLAVVTVWISLFVYPQDYAGIKLDHDLGWKQLVSKAKKDNKYIFVCVYPGNKREQVQSLLADQNTRNFFNHAFICAADSSNRISIPRRGQVLKVKSQVAFLFFSPKGKLVHRGDGNIEEKQLLNLGQDALQPNRQYYTLLKGYRSGEKNFTDIPYMVDIAQKMNDRETAHRLARDYIDNYLLKMTEDEVYTVKNLIFIGNNTRSTDKTFNMFYPDGRKVDAATRNDFSRDVVDYMMAIEEVDSKLWRDIDIHQPLTDNPDWEKMKKNIAAKTDTGVAERVVVNAKMRWYTYRGDGKAYCDALLEKVARYGIYGFLSDVNDHYNGRAWEIFQHTDDSAQLHVALKWSAISLEAKPSSPAYLDTYANILYRLGRVDEAISWEEKAAAANPQPAVKNYIETLEKMKKGEPTW